MNNTNLEKTVIYNQDDPYLKNKEHLKQLCNGFLQGLVGSDHDETWWNSPNGAFDGKTPAWVWDNGNPNDVFFYLNSHASGDYS